MIDSRNLTPPGKCLMLVSAIAGLAVGAGSISWLSIEVGFMRLLVFVVSTGVTAVVCFHLGVTLLGIVGIRVSKT